MKLTRKKLNDIIENVIIENMLDENSANVYHDPIEELFNSAFDNLEALGASLSAEDPAYVLIEDSLMKLMDAHDLFTGNN